MRHLLSYLRYTPCQRYQLLQKLNFYATHNTTRSIFSKSIIWDEEFSTPEVLKEVETHWKKVFEEQQQQHINHGLSSSSKKKYILAMFPYPSGQLHMGHVRVYTISDTLARYYRALGYQVIHPIGWDAFGLPAENAAIERNVSAASWTDQNISIMKDQFKQLGCSFDWWREVRTCDPDYYRWTQQLFLRLHKAGLVYKREAFVNWDPVDETVLANEQVDPEGRAWRSGAKVQRKLLDQWYIRATRFSKALHEGLNSPQLQDWRHIVQLQKNWIGECDGYTLDMKLATPTHHERDPSINSRTEDSDANQLRNSDSCLSVFTKHPELLYAVSFIAVRTDHFLVKSGYKKNAQTSSNESNLHLDEGKSALLSKYPLLNAEAINPLTQKSIPIIVSDDLPYNKDVAEYYVGYGSGSEVDANICSAWGFENLQVLQSGDLSIYVSEPLPNKKETSSRNKTEVEEAISNAGVGAAAAADVIINSGELSGLTTAEARTAALATLQRHEATVFPASPNLKDWLISRQRYWGTPIPMVSCPSCGTVPVPASELPVVLPTLADDATAASSQSRVIAGLKSYTQWRKCSCPQCGGAAERETDTMDTFVDSSWYFLRFLDPRNSSEPFSSAAANAGMPVDLYIGGVEHAVLHLYFARFFQHFLHSEHLTEHTEPFNRLLLIGRIKAPAYIRQSDGKYLPKEEVDLTVTPPVDRETRSKVQVLSEKMSKSRHNGVEPQAVVAQYSVDAVRLAVLRGESPVSNRDWRDNSLEPVIKFINLVWRTVGAFVKERQDVPPSEQEALVIAGVLSEACFELRKARNTTVRLVTKQMEDLLPNSAIRQLETFVRQIRSVPLSAMKETEFEQSLAALLVMLAPITPHLCAELWQAFAAHATLHTLQVGSVHEQPWPQNDEGFEPSVRFTCSVNDADLFKCELSPDEFKTFSEQKMIEDLLLHQAKVRNSIDQQPILKTTLDINESGSSMKLSIYTLDDIAIRQKKKENKLKKKQLKNEMTGKAARKQK